MKHKAVIKWIIGLLAFVFSLSATVPAWAANTKAVTNVAVTAGGGAAGQTAVTVTWTLPVGGAVPQTLTIKTYAATVGCTSLGTAVTTNTIGTLGTNSTATSYVVTSGLTAGSSYCATVSSASSGDTPSGDVASTGGGAKALTELATPTGVSLAKGGSAASPSVTVSWTAVTNNSGYSVQLSTSSTFASGNLTAQTATTGSTSYVWTGLTSNTTYYARVSAIGDASTYETSAVSSISAGAASTTTLATPATPTIAKGGNSSSPSITISWTSVTNNQGYTVEYSTSSTFASGNVSTSAVQGATSIVISSLTSNTTYYARITALGNTTLYANSAVSSISTGVASSSQLVAVAPTVSKGGNSSSPSITVSWTNVTGNAGYTIEYSTDATFATGVTSTSAATNATSVVISGLTSGGTYYARIKVLGDGTNYITSAFSSASSAVDASVQLATPSDPTLARGGSRANPSLTVTWGTVTGNAGYVIELDSDGIFTGTPDFTQTVGTGVTSAVFSSFTASGETFYVRIRVLGDGTNYISSGFSPGAVSVVTSQRVNTPAAPSVSRGGGSGASITVTWVDVAEDSGYSIEVSTDPTFATGVTSQTAATNATSIVFSNLTGGATYYARVTALGDADTRADSNASSASTGVTTITTFATPSAPTITKGGSSASPSITISWTSVANNQGYTVEYSTSSTFASNVTSVSAAQGDTSVVISGLSSATTYYARIKVLGDGTTYADSAFSSASTGVASSSQLVAAAPTVTKGGSSASSSITVSWTNVTGNAGYTIEISTDSTFASNVTSASALTNATSAVFNGLTSNTTYYARIKVLGDGTNYITSSFSSASTGGTSSTELATPSAPTITKGGSSASPSITVSWTNVTGNAGYTIEISTDSTFASGVTSSNAATNATSLVFSGLTSAATYYARIKVLGDGTNYITSAFSVASTGGAASTKLTVSAPTITKGGAAATPSITISWTDVTGNAGYTVEYSTSSTFASGNVSTSAVQGATSLVISGLTSNTTYYARITALGDGTNYITSAVSTISTGVASSATIATPSAPTTAKGGAAASPSITVSWTNVTGNGGYFVEYSTSSTFATVAGSTTTAANATSVVISGLISNTAYYARITVIGDGASYATSAVSTRSAAANSTTTLATPGTPTVNKGGSAASPSVRVTWTSVTNNNGYTVEISTDNTFATGVSSQTAAQGATSIVFEGLSSNTTYYARIKALGDTSNFATSAAYSTVSTGVASSTQLSAPSTPTLTKGGTVSASSVTVTWNTVANNNGYTVEISTDSTFASGVISNNVAAGSTSLVVSVGVTSNTTYYARVKVLGDGTNFATSASFSTVSNGVASSTTLDTVGTPSVSTSGSSSSSAITVTWTGVANNTGYTVQISTSSGFGTIAATCSAAADATSCVFNSLTSNTLYYVRILAVGDGTNFANAAAYSATASGTSSLVLSTPTATASTGSASGTLSVSWSAIPSASSYTVRVYSNVGLTTLVGSAYTNATSPFTSFTGLSEGVTYYITVQAIGTGVETVDSAASSGSSARTKATLLITPVAKSITYGAAVPATAFYTFNYTSGFISGESAANAAGWTAPTCTSTYTQSTATGAGVKSGAITCSGGAATFYNFQYATADLTVNKATLTATATAANITYGDNAPSYAFTLSGFVNSETSGSATFTDGYSAPTCTASYVKTAAGTGNAGTYTISCSGGSASNYSFSFVNANLTVAKKSITVTPTEYSIVYGAGAPAYAFTYTSGDFVNSETSVSSSFTTGLTAPVCSSTYVQTATGAGNVGSYQINCTSGSATNYSFTIANTGKFVTVTAKTLTVVADAKTATYGDVSPTYSFTLTGFANSETKDSSTFTTGYTAPSCTSNYTQTAGNIHSYPGSYAISCSVASAAATNYVFAFDLATGGANLVVGKKTLTVTADAKSATYGQAAPSYTATTTGWATAYPTDTFTTQPSCTSSYRTNDNAGDYTITCSLANAGAGYEISYVAGTLTVAKKTLTIIGPDVSLVYGAATQAAFAGFTTSGLINNDPVTGTTCSSNYMQMSSVGTYAITCSGASSANYNISFVDGTLSVTPRTLTVTADNTSVTYGDGVPAYLGFTASGFLGADTFDTGKAPLCITTYTQGSSVVAGGYNITCDNPSKIAVASNYTISYVSGVLTVDPYTVTVTGDSYTVTYGAAKPTLGYTDSGFILGGSYITAPTCTTTYGPTSPVSSYAVTCSGGVVSDNFTLDYVDGVIHVDKRAMTITASSSSVVYGNTYTVTYAVSALTPWINGDGFTTAPTCSTAYYTSATTTASVGTYSTTCSGAENPNYSFSYTDGSLLVTPKSLTLTANSYNITYGTAKPTIEFTVNGLVGTDTLVSDPTCTTSYSAGGVIGNYNNVCSGADVSANYTLPAGSYYTGITSVSRRTLSVKLFATVTYGDAVTSYAPAIEGFYGSDRFTIDPTCSSSYVQSIAGGAVGTYATTCNNANTGNIANGKGNNYVVVYSDGQLVNGAITVVRKVLNFKADDLSVRYGTASVTIVSGPEPGAYGLTWASSGFSKPVCSVSYSSITVVGTYPISCSGGLVSSNFTLNVSGATLTVLPKQVTLTPRAVSPIEYGSAKPFYAYDATGFIGTDTFSQSPTCSSTYEAGSSVGTYTITCSGASAFNYEFVSPANPVTFTVYAKSLSITAPSKTATYGELATGLNPAVTGFWSNDSFTTAPTCVVNGFVQNEGYSTSPVGNYPVTCSGAEQSNYNITYVSGTYTVVARRVTVTATDRPNVIYGDAAPAGYAYTAFGFVGNESWTLQPGTGTAPSCRSNYSSTSNVGEYAITCSSAAYPNYTFRYVDGYVTVTAKALTVIATSVRLTYGSDVPGTWGKSFDGLVNNDWISGLNCTSSYTKFKAAGTYQADIICSGGTNSNYSISYQRGNLTVDPRPITVTAGSYDITYGAPTPTLGYTHTDFVNGDGFQNDFGCTTNYVERSNWSVDGYDVVCNVTVNSNYSLTLVRGKIMVAKRQLTFTADNASTTYGDQLPSIGFTIQSGVLLPGDELLSNPNCTATGYQRYSNAGTYSIVCVGASAGINYEPVYVNGTLTVDKKSLMVTANNQSAVYGTIAEAAGYSTDGFVNGDDFTTAPECVNNQLVTTGAGDKEGLLSCSGAAQSNYLISYTAGTLTVTPLTVTVTANDKSVVYGTPSPSFHFTDPAFINGDVFETAPVCVSEYTLTSNVGTYTITCSSAEQGNYTFEYVPATLTVTQRALVLKAKDVTLSYGMDPEVYTVEGTGWVNGDDITSAPTCSTNPNYEAFDPVGTYVITCSDAGVSANYSVTYSDGVLTVTKQAIHYRAVNKQITYGDPAPVYTFTYTGLLPGDDLGTTPTCNSSYTSNLNLTNSDAGSYSIICSDAANVNYDITYSNATLTVKPYDITLYAKYTLPAGASYGYCSNDGAHNDVAECFITYGDNVPTYSYTASAAFLNGKTWASQGFTAPACSSGYTKTSAVDSYQVKCQNGVAPNYNITYSNIMMPVIKRSLVIYASTPGTIAYGDAAPIFKANTPIGFVNGDKLTTQPFCSSTYSVRSSVGRYTVTCNGDTANVSKIATQLSNYSIVYYTANFDVVQKVLQVKPTAYEIQYFDDVPAYDFAAGVVAGDSWDIEPVCTSAYVKGDAPQTFTITCTLGAISGNYDLQAPATADLVVTKRQVTVTAHDVNVTYGDATPSVASAYDVTGLVNNDVLTGISCATAYKAKDAVTADSRRYSVTCSATGSLSANYSVVFDNGNLTVAKKALTITATRSAASSVYGTGATFGFTTSGLLDGESLTLAPVCGVGLGTATHVGSHTVSCRDAVADNYTISYQTASWTVTKKSATVTAPSKTITTGNSAGLGSGTVTGLVNGDTLVATGICSSGYSVFSPERGNYTVTCSGASHPDYEISFLPGTLTVKNGDKGLSEFKINGTNVLGGGTATVLATAKIEIDAVPSDANHAQAAVQAPSSLKIGDNIIRIIVTAEDDSTDTFDATLRLVVPTIEPVVTEVPAGGTSVTYGDVTSITPLTNPTAGTVNVTVGNLTLSLGTTDSSGAVLPLLSNGLLMGSGDKFLLTLTGYLPGSEVKIWVMSTPTLVGTFIADANGVVNINTTLPSGLAAGAHTLQLAGIDKDREAATLSFGMTVATTKTGKATLAFKATSPKPSVPQTKQIAALAKSIKAAKFASVTLTGSVLGKGSSSDSKLAKTRDKAVANLIALFKANGVKATYVSKTAKGKQTGSKSISVAIALSWRN